MLESDLIFTIDIISLLANNISKIDLDTRKVHKRKYRELSIPVELSVDFSFYGVFSFYGTGSGYNCTDCYWKYVCGDPHKYGTEIIDDVYSYPLLSTFPIFL